MPKTEPPAEPRSALSRVPDGVWTPLATAIIALVPGLVGLALGRPALFPSLGPTALTQAHDPDHPSARPYNVVVSHLVGLGSAFLAVALFGIAMEKSVFELGHLTPARVGASVLALALAAALEMALRASHPPAASTTLLASLGTFHPTPRDTVTVVVGVLAVAAVGEVLRRVRARPGAATPG
ncbi:MAG TPA: HPP family protein [Longimicrobiaceae bacterium]|nr:HPP family protein [Longimicrobiaceae bacterium]